MSCTLMIEVIYVLLQKAHEIGRDYFYEDDKKNLFLYKIGYEYDNGTN